MKKALSVICTVLALAALITSCGGSDSVVARTISGSMGGCQISIAKPTNLRVGVMAYSDDWTKVYEIASVAVNPANGAFVITLEDELERTDPESSESTPYDFLNWTEHLGGAVYSAKLVVRAYLDENNDQTYTISADGSTVGSSVDDIYYFTGDYSEKGAQIGYNLVGSEGYNQKFTDGNFYIATYGCE